MPANTGAFIVAILMAAGLILAWQVSHALLLIISGILISTVLDAAVRGLGRVLPAPRPVLLAMVTLAIASAFLTAMSVGGISLWRSLQDLWQLLIGEVERLYGELVQLGGVDSSEIESILTNSLPDPGGVFNQASSIFGTTLGLLGDVVIVLFLGLFFAIAPIAYRDGFLLLIPNRHRGKVRDALDAAGAALRGWMITQLAMMVMIGSLVFGLLWALGIPNAPILGLLAGMFNFVPFLGPIISAVPVLLTLASHDFNVLILGALGLLLIQNLEGYILTPMLQKRTIRLSPAWSLSVMAIMGSLFGIMGVALATPIFAVTRTLVLKLYVEPREAGTST